MCVGGLEIVYFEDMSMVHCGLDRDTHRSEIPLLGAGSSSYGTGRLEEIAGVVE